MKNLFWVIVILSAFSCKHEPRTLKSGLWRATLEVQDSEELPFIFEAKADGTLIIRNADERIIVDEIKISGDSIRIQAPVFEGYFEGMFGDNGQTISGSFIKPSLDRIVPFKMVYGEGDRFRESVNDPITNISGNWETVFSPNIEADRYIAKGIFSQQGSVVTGTFRTTTGDYRYLEGVIDGEELNLSTFDGAHAFLFTGKVTDSGMEGYFYSGNHWKEPFRAKRNENYELPDAKELTFLKEGYDKLAFSFPDASGKLVSLDDERFKGKVTLVQLMGSWCPNCLEESKFYVDYLNEHPEVDLEIVGIAFEYALTKEKAFDGIKRLKDRLGIEYPILLAQYGDSDKKKANDKFPMLNHIISYPTTIYLDKKGAVRRIHTGYNGTATGKAHQDFKADFEDFIATLTEE